MKKILFTILPITAVLLFSCTKETRPGPQAQVKFINASVNTASAEVTFDGALLVAATGFPTASNYAFVNVGTPTIKIQATATTGTTVLITNTTGISSFQSNINYTIIATDSVSKLKVSVVTDDLITPAAGKSSIRFFHLAGNAPYLSVDTATTTAGATLFSSRIFNDQSTNSSASSFISVNAGTYTFTARNAVTNAVVFTKSIVLASGRIYTIAATGAVDGAAGTPAALDFTVLTNN